MKIKLIFLGKKNSSGLFDSITNYVKRIQYHYTCELIFLSISNKNKKQTDFQKIMNLLKSKDEVILIDETGLHYNSISFSKNIQKKMNLGFKNIVFMVGDAYGFPADLYKRANQIISLSKLTFTHEIARLVLVEQLYRSITIIQNHPYHHE